MRRILAILFLLFFFLILKPNPSFAQQPRAVQCNLTVPPQVSPGEPFPVKTDYTYQGNIPVSNNGETQIDPGQIKLTINGTNIPVSLSNVDIPSGTARNNVTMTINSVSIPQSITGNSFQVQLSYPVIAALGSSSEEVLATCQGTIGARGSDVNAGGNNNQAGGAASTGSFTTVVKPLKLFKNPDGTFDQNKLDNYSDDPKTALDPWWINEGDTRIVDIYFLNIPKGQKDSRKPGTYTDYYVCLNSDRVECEKRPDAMIKVEENNFSINKYNLPADADVQAVYGDSDSMISVRVCGNGGDSLKAGASNCLPYKDVWFHGSKVYRVGLYENDRKTLVGEAIFYSRMYYPNVYVATKDQPNDFKLVASTTQNLQTNSSFGYIKDPKQPEKKSFLPPNGFLLFGGILYIQLTGLHHPSGYDQNQNNYQIVIEGQTHKYKSVKCITVRNNTSLNPSARNLNDIQSFDVGEDGEKLGPGQYLMKINEEVNEGRARLPGPDDCAGEFTYWYIYFDIVEEKNGERRLIIKKSVQDPNQSDADFSGYDIQLGRGKLPCVTKDGKQPQSAQAMDALSCDYIYLPILGVVATEPTAFLKSLLSVILGLAGVIIIVIFVLNGYKLMTSAGDKQKIAEARERITSAIIGLVFVLFALIILQFITVDILQLPGFTK